MDVGQIAENDGGGERIVFRRTAASTGGEAVVIEVHLPPGGRGPGRRHPEQEVRFQVVRGRVVFRLGRQRVERGEGERLTVTAGTRYAYRNPGPGAAIAVAEIRPALDFEEQARTA